MTEKANAAAAQADNESQTPTVSQTAQKAVDPTLVTVGQPTEGGCVWFHYGTGATLPTDAVASMATMDGYVSLGDVSENGFTLGRALTVNKFKNWNGEVVLSSPSDDQETAKIEFIEVNRTSVAQLRFGKDNVVDAGDGSVKEATAKAGTVTKGTLVIDELESNGYKRRTVMPLVSPESFDDETHQKGSLLMSGMTFTMLANDAGFMHKVYRAKPSE